jgi:threonine/homoserine/homoserine lactone efflux protein
MQIVVPPDLALFVTAGLALNVTPGPDMLYVVARSTGEGRRAGIVSALGIAAGSLVHLALVVGGVAGLLLAVPAAYEVVRWAGAAYLVYLGVRSLMAASRAEDARPAPASLGAIFRQGVVTNVLNPKVAVFFLAFLPQFADPARGGVEAQLVFLGLLFNVTGTAVNVAVALAAARVGTWSRARGGAGAWLRRLPGAVFIALGLRLAFARRG